MSNLKYLSRDEVIDGDKVIYFTYTLPDTSSYSNYNTQAKSLIEELKVAIPLMKEQAKRMHDNTVNIIADDSRIINELKEKLRVEAQEHQTKVNDLTNQIEELKNNQNNDNTQSLIDDLTKKADELNRESESATEPKR